MPALKRIRDVAGMFEDWGGIFTTKSGQRKFTGFGFLSQVTMLDNALRCLKNVTLDKTSLYVKALMAYVFTLNKDMEMRGKLLDMLEEEIGRLWLFRRLSVLEIMTVFKT